MQTRISHVGSYMTPHAVPYSNFMTPHAKTVLRVGSYKTPLKTPTLTSRPKPLPHFCGTPVANGSCSGQMRLVVSTPNTAKEQHVEMMSGIPNVAPLYMNGSGFRQRGSFCNSHVELLGFVVISSLIFVPSREICIANRGYEYHSSSCHWIALGVDASSSIRGQEGLSRRRERCKLEAAKRYPTVVDKLTHYSYLLLLLVLQRHCTIPIFQCHDALATRPRASH